MGMFDYVDAPPVTCECGTIVKGWQSKDADCTLDTVSVDAVDHYYSACDKCHMWHEFIRPRTIPPFEHWVRPFARFPEIRELRMVSDARQEAR